MLIRNEEPQDHDSVYDLNLAAFETDAEARLVDALRRQAPSMIALVAEMSGKVVGHIVFTPVTLSDHPDLKIAGLAPMAVAENLRGSGIGSQLVKAGLEQCREQGYVAVVVLGHPDYYPRFGFVSSSGFDIRSEYDVPENVFMVRELQPGALAGAKGVIRYHPAFGTV